MPAREAGRVDWVRVLEALASAPSPPPGDLAAAAANALAQGGDPGLVAAIVRQRAGAVAAARGSDAYRALVHNLAVAALRGSGGALEALRAIGEDELASRIEAALSRSSPGFAEALAWLEKKGLLSFSHDAAVAYLASRWGLEGVREAEKAGIAPRGLAEAVEKGDVDTVARLAPGEESRRVLVALAAEQALAERNLEALRRAAELLGEGRGGSEAEKLASEALEEAKRLLGEGRYREAAAILRSLRGLPGVEPGTLRRVEALARAREVGLLEAAEEAARVLERLSKGAVPSRQDAYVLRRLADLLEKHRGIASEVFGKTPGPERLRAIADYAEALALLHEAAGALDAGSVEKATELTARAVELLRRAAEEGIEQAAELLPAAAGLSPEDAECIVATYLHPRAPRPR